MARVPPSHTANRECDFKVRAAAEICPGSPHSVKNSDPKDTRAARYKETLASGVSGNVSCSSNQISVADTKNAQALTTSVHREFSWTITRPSKTAANILAA